MLPPSLEASDAHLIPSPVFHILLMISVHDSTPKAGVLLPLEVLATLRMRRRRVPDSGVGIFSVCHLSPIHVDRLSRPMAPLVEDEIIERIPQSIYRVFPFIVAPVPF